MTPMSAPTPRPGGRTIRLLGSGAVLVLGPLQAWDSGLFAESSAVIALGLAGVLVPAVAYLFIEDRAWHAGAVLVSGVLLLIARIMAAQALNELHLITFVAALPVLASRLIEQSRAAGAGARD